VATQRRKRFYRPLISEARVRNGSTVDPRAAKKGGGICAGVNAKERCFEPTLPRETSGAGENFGEEAFGPRRGFVVFFFFNSMMLELANQGKSFGLVVCFLYASRSFTRVYYQCIKLGTNSRWCGDYRRRSVLASGSPMTYRRWAGKR